MPVNRGRDMTSSAVGFTTSSMALADALKGFNAAFSISIALPIVQSVIRHVEAGGFGEEVAEGYKGLISGR